MTKEQVHRIIANKLRSNIGDLDLERIQEELNQELNPEGWSVGPLTGDIATGIGCDVQAIPATPAVAAVPIPDPAPARSHSGGGVTCRKCKNHNPYLDVPSELDGTHLCYSCKH